MKNTMTVLLTMLYFILSGQEDNNQKLDNRLLFTTLFSSENNDEVFCYRIPAIVTAPNGDLVVAADERVPSCGDLRNNKDINIIIRRSSDNGITWSENQTVADYPYGQSASDPSMIVDRVSGNILMFYNFMDHEQDSNVYYFKLAKSPDNGKTWSDPVDITSQIIKPEWHHDFKFITSGRGMQTADGRLIHTLVDLENSLHLFGSDDHGETWSLIDIPIIPGDESIAVELSDGSWMVNSRVNNLGCRYVHLSDDEGNSWISAPDSSLLDPGCNTSLIRHSSTFHGGEHNLLLFSNANDRHERKNLAVKLSYDEGRTWTKGKTVYAGSSAYSSMTILANGDIGLVFEKDDYHEIAFVRLTLQWLTDEN